MNVAHKVFSDQYLASTAPAATLITSAPVRMVGNALTASVFVKNVTSTPTCTFKMQGSYDGVVWFTLGSTFTQNVFGPNQGSASAVDCAFVRLEVVVTTGTSAVLFDATLAMSAQ